MSDEIALDSREIRSHRPLNDCDALTTKKDKVRVTKVNQSNGELSKKDLENALANAKALNIPVSDYLNKLVDARRKQRYRE